MFLIKVDQLLYIYGVDPRTPPHTQETSVINWSGQLCSLVAPSVTRWSTSNGRTRVQTVKLEFKHPVQRLIFFSVWVWISIPQWVPQCFSKLKLNPQKRSMWFWSPPLMIHANYSQLNSYHSITDQISQVAFPKTTLISFPIQEDQSFSHRLGRVVGETFFPFLHISEDIWIWTTHNSTSEGVFFFSLVFYFQQRIKRTDLSSVRPCTLTWPPVHQTPARKRVCEACTRWRADPHDAFTVTFTQFINSQHLSTSVWFTVVAAV